MSRNGTFDDLRLAVRWKNQDCASEDFLECSLILYGQGARSSVTRHRAQSRRTSFSQYHSTPSEPPRKTSSVDRVNLSRLLGNHQKSDLDPEKGNCLGTSSAAGESTLSTNSPPKQNYTLNKNEHLGSQIDHARASRDSSPNPAGDEGPSHLTKLLQRDELDDRCPQPVARQASESYQISATGDDASRSEERPTLSDPGKWVQLLTGYTQVIGSYALIDCAKSEHNLPRVQLPHRRVDPHLRHKRTVSSTKYQSQSQNHGQKSGGSTWQRFESTIGSLFGDSGFSETDSRMGIGRKVDFVQFMQSSPSVLFINLDLEIRECKVFQIKQRLPRTLPPTLRGLSFMIRYEFVIGIQEAIQGKENHKIRRALFPFNLTMRNEGAFMALAGGRSIIDPASVHTCNTNEPGDGIASIEDDSMDNRSIEDFRALAFYIQGLLKETTTIEMPSQVESGSVLNSQSTLIDADADAYAGAGALPMKNTFVVSRTGKKVAFVMINHSQIRAGESIELSFKFFKSGIRVIGISCALEASEHIKEDLTHSNASSDTRTVHISKTAWTLSHATLGLSIPFPKSIPPSIDLDVGSVEWNLRTEFMIAEARGVNLAVEKRASDHNGRDVLDRGLLAEAAPCLRIDRFTAYLPVRVMDCPDISR